MTKEIKGPTFGNAFRELMEIRGEKPVSSKEIQVTSHDPMYNTPFQFDRVTTEVLAARAVAANDLWEMKTGKRQKIALDTRIAGAQCQNGTPLICKKNDLGEYESIPTAPEFAKMVSLTQPWETATGRYFLPHTNLPHLEKRVLSVIECTDTPEDFAKTIRKWNPEALDQAIADANACGGIVYTPEEWLEHPHGKYLASIPVVTITRIADSEKVSLPEDQSAPLAGIRVVDQTRILAGPTCSVSLAEHGADVLMVTSPELPQVPAFVRDTSHGKRSCFLDYKKPEEAKKLRELLRDADIYVQGYRPEALARNGFGPKDVAKINPNIIYVSVNCFGNGGPLAGRAGWDQVAQAVTGMCVQQGELAGDGTPQLTPVFACDFLTGYLGAFGAMLALKKRAREGGSYHVEVSLCQSAMLLQRQGFTDNYRNADGKLTKEEFDAHCIYENGTVYGDLKCLAPAIEMSETPLIWKNVTPKLGGGEAKW